MHFKRQQYSRRLTPISVQKNHLNWIVPGNCADVQTEVPRIVIFRNVVGRRRVTCLDRSEDYIASVTEIPRGRQDDFE